MAITNATRVADFGSGIGTEGAVLKVDNTNKRIGIGTNNPNQMLQVGTAVSVYGNSGIVSATSFYGDGTNLSGLASTDFINATQLNVIGVATASSFVGNVTGNASGTAGGLTGTPDITVRNVTGVAATFTGVLTYEDVTNVDSVGLITARSGIQFGAAGVGGTIRANGDTTLVGVLTATKMVVNENSAFNDADEYLLVKNTGAACNISIVGGTGNHSSLNLGDTDDFNIQRIRSGHTDNSLALFTADTSRLHLDNSGRIGINTTTFGDAREALRVQSPPGQTGTFLTILSNEGGSSQLFFGDNDFNEGRIDYDHSTNTMGLYTNDSERFLVADSGVNVTGICTVTVGTDLDGFKVEEGKYDTNALNGEFNFEFENGHLQTHTGSTAGTYFPDFRVSSSISLDSVMDVGDVVSATLIVAASNTAHYCTTGIKIDNSTSNVTIEWIGSSAPSAGKGAGYDIYSFTIQKTAATPAYLVIVNATDAG